MSSLPSKCSQPTGEKLSRLVRLGFWERFFRTVSKEKSIEKIWHPKTNKVAPSLESHTAFAFSIFALPYFSTCLRCISKMLPDSCSLSTLTSFAFPNTHGAMHHSSRPFDNLMIFRFHLDNKRLGLPNGQLGRCPVSTIPVYWPFCLSGPSTPVIWLSDYSDCYLLLHRSSQILYLTEITPLMLITSFNAIFDQILLQFCFETYHIIS